MILPALLPFRRRKGLPLPPSAAAPAPPAALTLVEAIYDPANARIR